MFTEIIYIFSKSKDTLQPDSPSTGNPYDANKLIPLDLLVHANF